MGLLKMKNTVTQMRNGLIKRFDKAEGKKSVNMQTHVSTEKKLEEIV